MSSLFSSWVSRLRGRREESELKQDEVAQVQVGPDGEGLLSVGSSLVREPLFCVRASLAGPLTEQPGEGGAVLVTIPVSAEGRTKPWLRVRVRHLGEGSPLGEPLLVLSRTDRHREKQVLEFRVDAGYSEISYHFEADPSLEICAIAPAATLPSLFPQIPTASRMVEFLHEVTHQKRRTPQILANLARSASPATAARVEALVASLPPSPQPEPIVAALGQLFAAHGRRMNPDSLAAFCLLVELDRGEAAQVSPGSAVAVADLFGIPLDQEAWQAGFEASGPYAEARAAADEPGTVALVAQLRQQTRNPLDILEDLGRDTGSRRVAAATRHLRPHLPGGRIRTNDEQQALLPLLQANGRRVHPETMVALCLFVDLETGALPEEGVDLLPAAAETVDTSVYAMVAVAGAFGLALEAFAMEGEPGDAEVEVIGRLAASAGGGILACFRHPRESGRYWEWIRSEEDFRRAQEHGLDFSGLVLAHLEGNWRDEPLRPLDADRLHGQGEILSREQMALRRIQGILRHLGPGGLERASLRTEPQVFAAACDWLCSGGAAHLLDPLAPGETRRQMVLALHRGELDVRVDRVLLSAATAARPALELLGLFLLQDLSVSPHLKLEGSFKHCDERAVRSLLLERASNLLLSEDASLRALAPRLLAAGDLAADRATRLGMEYPLGMARVDVDPAVQAAATEALTRLALGELFPLPAALELVPLQPGEAVPVLSVLSPADFEAVTVELRSWLVHVSKADSIRPMGLPITDSAGALDLERSRPVVEILAAIHQACRHDGSLGRARWLALVSLEELAASARALLESWRLLARQEGKALDGLDPQRCHLDYRFLLEDQASRLLQRCGGLPTLGGPNHPLALNRVEPGRHAGPWTTYEKARGLVVTEEAPIFTELLERARRGDLTRVRVLRLPGFKPVQPEGLPERHTARIDAPIELREIEVLDTRRVEFTPGLRWIARNRVELSLDSEPLEDLQAVLSLAEGRRPRAAATPRVEEGSARPPAPDEDAFPRAAASLARQFELEGAQERLLRLLHQALG